MKSAITQSKKNVVSMHLRNATKSNKTVRIIHMPTREEAISMFIRFLRNHNTLTKHSSPEMQRADVVINTRRFRLTTKHKDMHYWSFTHGVNNDDKLYACYNVDKPDFTDDATHLFDMLSDTWEA